MNHACHFVPHMKLGHMMETNSCLKWHLLSHVVRAQRLWEWLGSRVEAGVLCTAIERSSWLSSRAPDALPKGSLLKFSSNSRTSTKTTVTMEAISNHAEEEVRRVVTSPSRLFVGTLGPWATSWPQPRRFHQTSWPILKRFFGSNASILLMKRASQWLCDFLSNASSLFSAVDDLSQLKMKTDNSPYSITFIKRSEECWIDVMSRAFLHWFTWWCWWAEAPVSCCSFSWQKMKKWDSCHWSLCQSHLIRGTVLATISCHCSWVACQTTSRAAWRASRLS